MAQNLRSTLYSPDGTAIPFAHTYNDNESFAEDYDRLYTYSSALRDGTGSSIQGACPTGWQIPMESHLNAVINQNSNASNKATYGLLYNWKAVMRNSSSFSSRDGARTVSTE